MIIMIYSDRFTEIFEMNVLKYRFKYHKIYMITKSLDLEFREYNIYKVRVTPPLVIPHNGKLPVRNLVDYSSSRIEIWQFYIR